MIYKQHNCGSYNIHTIKTDKFKTFEMEIFFRNNIDVSNVAKRSFLFDMLVENSKEYKSKKELALKQEELFSSHISSSTLRVGSMVMSTITLESLNPKYIDDETFEEIIKLPFDLLFNPNVTDNEFDSSTVEFIRDRTIDDIISINENPTKKAYREALLKMDPNSLPAINIMGTVEEVKDITPSDLYKIYEEILKHDYIDIYIIGNFDEDKIINLVNKYANFNTIKNHEVKYLIEQKTRSKVLEAKDQSTNNASQIICLYNTNELTDREMKYVLPVYNQILGGGSLETKLYRNLRDKESLCYTVKSMFNRFDNILSIVTGVNKDNIEKAKKEIINTYNEMKDNITEEELSTAISSIISSITISNDYQNRIIDNYLLHNIVDADLYEEKIKSYKSVTLDEVKNVYKKIKPNTIYVLEGE